MFLPGHRLQTDFSDCDPDLEEPFYILKHMYCPVVLTENGFMDSRESLRFLESPEGRKAMVGVVVEGVIEFL